MQTTYYVHGFIKNTDMVTGTDIKTLIENLEKQELESAICGVAVPALTYTQLLALYLHENDLCNAKYLWKRIPATVKTSSKELQNIWKVGQKMWQRDFPGIYACLNEQWSTDVSEIMENIRAKVRQRAASLVATAYSSINLDTLSEFTGLSSEEAEANALSCGWNIDATTKIVQPCKPTPGPMQIVSCEEQLSKLTDFVSFLEN